MNKATLLHLIKDLPDEAEFQVMTNFREDNGFEPVTLMEVDDDVNDWEKWDGVGDIPKKTVVKLIAE